MSRIGIFRGIVLLLLLGGCSDGIPNNPYRDGDIGGNTYFNSFSTAPDHLDPAITYYSHEYAVICNIYEPPLQYHLIKRPYVLEPLTATKIPTPVFFDAGGNTLPADADDAKIARVMYEITVKPGIMYQPHPCFARNSDGQPLYRGLKEEDLDDIETIADFPERGTRELIAEDYVRQIKRLAHPKLNSPLLSTMSKYIVGLREYAVALRKDLDEERNRRRREQGTFYNQEIDEKEDPIVLDLDRHPFEGSVVVDRYTYRIFLKRRYPQMLYWFAMPFFVPIPREAEEFYLQKPLLDRNITLDRCPVGTGPYRLDRLIPEKEIVFVRNENYHEDRYPAGGLTEGVDPSLLEDRGKKLPFIDRIVWKREKEPLTRWNKFLQGYYDVSGIMDDSFDQSIRVTASGSDLSDYMKERRMQLYTTVDASTRYIGFNMADDVIGGLNEAGCKLRQAIGIVLDTEEYLQIFANGRGIVGHGPIPPGIFGYEEGREAINPFIFNWDDARRRPRRKTIEDAKRLLAEAGYPNGVGRDGKPLKIGLDHSATGPEYQSMINWLIRKFNSLGITLENRVTDLNALRDKFRQGTFQIFMGGWNADYPDPENFHFLLYGPNGHLKHHGENNTNYENTEFDRLFKKMECMEDTQERMDIIRKMNRLLQHDAPWINVYHPVSFTLCHSWYRNVSLNQMVSNGMKYKRLIAEEREAYVRRWNEPVFWPLAIVLAVLVVGSIPAAISVRRKRHGSVGRVS